jgi:eukaryotic-like serine/threonine-protein kinase
MAVRSPSTRITPAPPTPTRRPRTAPATRNHFISRAPNSRIWTNGPTTGDNLVFERPDPATGWDTWLLPLTGERKPVPYLRSPFNENSGVISCDGRWISYTSDESGKSEVYVQSFPAPRNKYQVSTGGAFFAVWSKSCKEMIIFTPDAGFMSAEVQTTPTFKASPPRPLFKLRPDAVGFAISADCQRFLATVPVGQSSASSVMLEINWRAGLKRR